MTSRGPFSGFRLPEADSTYSREQEQQFRRELESVLLQLSQRIDGQNVARSDTLTTTGHNNYILGTFTNTLRATVPSGGSEITGFAGGFADRSIKVVNISSNLLTLVHEDAGSDAENRIDCPLDQNVILTEGESVELFYDADVQRWRLIRPRGPAVASVTLGAGDNDDYALDASLDTLRVSANASGSTLTGIANGTGGRKVRIINVSANPLTLAHEDTGSTAANRLTCPGGVDVVLTENDAADLEYDATSSRWRVLRPAVPQILSMSFTADEAASSNVDVDYSVTWTLSAAVTDAGYQMRTSFFDKANKLVSEQIETSPVSNTTETATDSGAGDGVGDTHYCTIQLETSAGALIGSASRSAICTV